MGQLQKKTSKEIWIQLVCESKFKVITLMSDAEKGLLKDKKIICKKPFSTDPETNEAVCQFFVANSVTIIRGYDETTT
jgi:hypothetical protein